MNIWGLLETEGVPSCSPDLHCAKDRTMGMTLLLSRSGARFTWPVITFLAQYPALIAFLRLSHPNIKAFPHESSTELRR